MSNESITVSLEMAKRLKEAGWEQLSSVFCWSEIISGAEVIGKEDVKLWLEQYGRGDEDIFSDAPTAEEILRRLPHMEPGKCEGIADLEMTPIHPDRWRVAYNESGVGYHIKFEEDTLANAAAQMWIYLSDNKLLS